MDQSEFALYVQDTWRPMAGLTLNLGLRWEAQWNQDAPLEDNGVLSRNPAMPGLDSIGLEHGNIPDDLNNVAPRFGFARDPSFNSSSASNCCVWRTAGITPESV